MPGSHGLDERTVAIAVTLVGIGGDDSQAWLQNVRYGSRKATC
jgi:hypothetical protein